MQRSLAAIAAGFLAVMIMAPWAGAQEQPEPAGVPPRIGVSGRTELSLIETLNMALANNKDIESSRIDREISRFSLTGAEGVYDFRVGAQTHYLKSVTPIGSVLGGGPDGELTQRDVGVVPQLSGSIPWTGASFSLNFNSKRTVNNSTFSTLNPQFPSSMTASITQPLRRGLRFDANRQRIEVARKNMALTDEQFRQRVTDIVTQVTRAYWDLAFTRRNLDVQVKAAETARRQVESNRRMVEQGVLAPMDVVEAETQLAQLTQDVFTAQALLSTAENLLKAMILPERTSPLWWSELVPTTPPDGAPAEELLQDAVDEALAARPELAQVKTASEINQTNLRYYKEQTKPQLDLVASYMAAGLSGRGASIGAQSIYRLFSRHDPTAQRALGCPGVVSYRCRRSGRQRRRSAAGSGRRLRPVAFQPVYFGFSNGSGEPAAVSPAA